jgi:agmatinase
MYEKFCLNLSEEKEADFVIFGALLGKRSEEMLKSLRKNSWFVEWFDLDDEKNLIEGVKVFDSGNIRVKKGSEISEKVKKILEDKKIPFMFSISHLATYFSLKPFSDDIKVVSFDAHFDVKNSYIDEKMVESVFPLKLNKEEIKRLNRGTWARRSFEECKRKFCFVGVRSCDEFDLEFVKRNNFLYFTPAMIRENFDEVKEKFRDFLKDSKIYLTVDIDAFDPSVAPAVGHPEPDGIFWHQFKELVKELKGKIVGLDLVEVDPIRGNTVTEFLATRIIFQLLSIGKS